MRPAIEVWHDAYQEWADTEGPIEQWAIKPAAVIEAYAAEREAAAHAKAVAEIVAELRSVGSMPAQIYADHIEAKFGGRDG